MDNQAPSAATISKDLAVVDNDLPTDIDASGSMTADASTISPSLINLPVPLLDTVLSHLPLRTRLLVRLVHRRLAVSIAETHLTHFFFFPHPPSVAPLRLLAPYLTSLTVYLPVFANPLAAPHYHHAFIHGVPELEALWKHFCAREVEVIRTKKAIGSAANRWGLCLWGMGARGERACTWPVDACEEIGEVTQWDVDGVVSTVKESLKGSGGQEAFIDSQGASDLAKEHFRVIVSLAVEVDITVEKMRISPSAGPPEYQPWEHESGGIDGVRYDERGHPIVEE